MSAAKTEADGANSLNKSTRFDSVSTMSKLTPVALPPGRLRLVTKPDLAGSSPTKFDPDIVTFRPTQFRERAPKRSEPRRRARLVVREAHQHADQPHPLALLCVRAQRPKRSRTNNNLEQSAAPHPLSQALGLPDPPS